MINPAYRLCASCGHCYEPKDMVGHVCLLCHCHLSYRRMRLNDPEYVDDTERCIKRGED